MNPSLSALVKTGKVTDSSSAPRSWRTVAATLLPWALLIAFLALLFLILGHRILPARVLEIATVVTTRENVDGTEAAVPREVPAPTTITADFTEAPMLFQASGWIEPDPHPVMATALVDGVLETVQVLEGEDVKRGQVLARLIDDDARLDLETAQSRLASLEAQSAAHDEQISVARAEIESLEKQVAAAEARRDETGDLSERLKRSGAGSVSEREVARARLELATRNAEIEALAITEAELAAQLRRLVAIQEDFSARIAEAETEVARRKLSLDRTRIVAPIDGRILRLLAMPGQKKMLRMDDHLSATVAILYDPGKLQARIDVPLSEAARLTVGQPVRLRSELLPDQVFQGRVTRILGEADLQRNTLQAKVAIGNPDDRLRPEMLCRAEFLGQTTGAGGKPEPASTGEPSAGLSRVRVFVPIAAIRGLESDPAPQVWKVDPSGERVVIQAVSLGHETREDHRLVLEGLKPGDRVVLGPPADLEPGQRFRAAGSSSAPPSSPSPPADS